MAKNQSYPNIVIKKNAGDSNQYSPRAVIAVYPYKTREIFSQLITASGQEADYGDYLKLKYKTIIITDDILSLNISTKKGGASHSLQAVLAPGDFNYLSVMAPGDYVCAWIVNDQSDLDFLISQLQNNESANSYNMGLKFFGKVFVIQESFKVNGNGLKTLRYNLTASGFNEYNSQIFYSPFLNDREGGTDANALFAKDFYSSLNIHIINGKNVTGQISDEQLSCHTQFIAMHKLLLGSGPGGNKDANPLKTVNGAFGVPIELLKTFNKEGGASSQKTPTFADLVNVIIGVQKYQENNHGVLGPDVQLSTSIITANNVYGTYYEPKSTGDDSKWHIKGKKPLSVSPTINGTIFSILEQLSNPMINETYVTLRPAPNKAAEIVPTLVCRQIPFSKDFSTDGFTVTNFLDLPRFEISNDIVTGYEISRAEALRNNCVMVQMDVRLEGAVGKPGQAQFNADVLAIKNGNWDYDANDVRRHGLRMIPAKIDQDYLNIGEGISTVIPNYTQYLTDIWTNMHLRFTGTIQTVGIQEPICIGENLQFNDYVFHIEGVDHAYQVADTGLTIFRTTLTLTHGINSDNVYDDIVNFPTQSVFSIIQGGAIKDTIHATVLVDNGNGRLAGDNGSNSGNIG